MIHVYTTKALEISGQVCHLSLSRFQKGAVRIALKSKLIETNTRVLSGCANDRRVSEQVRYTHI